MLHTCFTIGALGTLLVGCAHAAPATPRTAALLQEGQEPVRIVCFGDSITGVYYHTGGHRAYCDMVGIGLRRLYPQAQLTMLNAGISGNTTVAALARIDRDVLEKQPHLVTVMFGMNDVTGVPPEQYRDNLHTIVNKCREIGAEVLLCTPNSIYAEDDRRPVDKLAQYAQIVRDLAAATDVALVDCYKAYEDIRAEDDLEWKLLMSETIHPGMNGHKLFAEQIVTAIGGEPISLADEPPPALAIPHVRALLSAGEPVNVIAMEPYDALIAPALQAIVPGAQVNVTPWPVAGQDLAQIEAAAKGIREQKPDLVLVAVPASASAPDDEKFVRSYSWVLNWSLSFGLSEWDCVAIAPSVTDIDLSETDRATEAFALRIIRGQDIGYIVRPAEDDAPAADLLRRWLAEQLAGD